MTEQQTPRPVSDGASTPQQRHAQEPDPYTSDTWSGWVRFGGVMMAVIGGFAIIEGILALASSTTYVATGGAVLAIDLSGWGWLHLILGVLVLATGVSLLGRVAPAWARVAGIVLVAINMVVQLAWLPAYPIWSIILLVLDVVVLYALVVTWDGSRG